MKVFLTGVNGFLGRSLAAHLRERGHQVLGCGRGDVVEVSTFRDCDVVIHAAHDFAAGAIEKNIEGTLARRDLAAQAGVRRQIFLTSYSARADAESEYGITKYRLEQSFSDTMRLGLVIGDGGLFARQRAALLRTAVVPMIGAGESPVAVIALSHVLAATEVILNGGGSGRWNLFYDARPTMKELVLAVKKHAGQRARLFPMSPRFAAGAVKIAKAIGLAIPVDAGQIRALLRNEDSLWKSDLPALLPGRCAEFQLGYALDRLLQR
jgi:nucleoside-diphosphate-sugar epimerase